MPKRHNAAALIRAAVTYRVPAHNVSGLGHAIELSTDISLVGYALERAIFAHM
jgi:hypothetical protein